MLCSVGKHQWILKSRDGFGGLGGGGRLDGKMPDTKETRLLRKCMVQVQLEGRGITDQRVLSVMGEVPRHWFCLPGTSTSDAYGDYPLSIGWGQTISQPLMVADMLQHLQLSGSETVLEVGTGSGYNAALLSQLANRVISLEIVPELVDQSRDLLRRGGFSNVEVIQADGSQGWLPAAPYDAVVVTAGAPIVPAALKEQLSIGGRLVIPVGSKMQQRLLVVQRAGAGFTVGDYGECRFVPLHGKYGWDDPRNSDYTG